MTRIFVGLFFLLTACGVPWSYNEYGRVRPNIDDGLYFQDSVETKLVSETCLSLNVFHVNYLYDNPGYENEKVPGYVDCSYIAFLEDGTYIAFSEFCDSMPDALSKYSSIEKAESIGRYRVLLNNIIKVKRFGVYAKGGQYVELCFKVNSDSTLVQYKDDMTESLNKVFRPTDLRLEKEE